MVYALIRNNIVQNTIIAEPEFIALVSDDWDYCVRIDNIETPDRWTKEGEEDVFEDPSDESWTHVPGIKQPAIGWSYDGQDFSEPQE